MKKFILLQPMSPSFWGLSRADFVRITQQDYGCGVLISQQEEQQSIYVTSDTKEKLEYLCSHNDLDGLVLEYTGVYDQMVEYEQCDPLTGS